MKDSEKDYYLNELKKIYLYSNGGETQEKVLTLNLNEVSQIVQLFRDVLDKK